MKNITVCENYKFKQEFRELNALCEIAYLSLETMCGIMCQWMISGYKLMCGMIHAAHTRHNLKWMN